MAVPAEDQKVTALAIFLGAVASIGGFMFGYVRYVQDGQARVGAASRHVR